MTSKSNLKSIILFFLIIKGNIIERWIWMAFADE